MGFIRSNHPGEICRCVKDERVISSFALCLAGELIRETSLTADKAHELAFPFQNSRRRDVTANFRPVTTKYYVQYGFAYPTGTPESSLKNDFCPCVKHAGFERKG